MIKYFLKKMRKLSYNDVVGKMEEDEMEEQNNFGMGGGGMIDMLRNEEQTYVNNVEFERE
jgi:hypothetical protein